MSDEIQVYNEYVAWANTLDSAGKDSGPAKGRMIGPTVLARIHANMGDIIELSQRADQLKKWVFYGKTTEKTYPIRPRLTDLQAIRADHYLDHNAIRIYHALLGLFTEVGELFENFHAHIFEGEKFDWVNFSEEVGDLFWYMALLAKAGDYPTFIPFLMSNRAKLTARYGDTWTQEGATNRDHEAEMKALTESIHPDSRPNGGYQFEMVKDDPDPDHEPVKVASMAGVEAAETGTCPFCLHRWHTDPNTRCWEPSCYCKGDKSTCPSCGHKWHGVGGCLNAQSDDDCSCEGVGHE